MGGVEYCRAYVFDRSADRVFHAPCVWNAAAAGVDARDVRPPPQSVVLEAWPISQAVNNPTRAVGEILTAGGFVVGSVRVPPTVSVVRFGRQRSAADYADVPALD